MNRKGNMGCRVAGDRGTADWEVKASSAGRRSGRGEEERERKTRKLGTTG